MENLLQTIVVTLVMAGVNVGGTFCLKLSTDPNKELFFAGGVVAYVIGATLYVVLLKNNGLATLSVASSILQMGLIVTLAIWMGEKVSTVQISALVVGMSAAAVAMIAAAV